MGSTLRIACLAATVFTAASCEIETLQEKYEEKVVGTWAFSEVKKLKLLDNQTVTADYEPTLLEFQADGTLHILDKNTGALLASGTWDMDEETQSDGETTTSYVSLETRFDGSYNGVDYSFDEATVTRLNNDAFCFRESKLSKNKRVELKRF